MTAPDPRQQAETIGRAIEYGHATAADYAEAARLREAVRHGRAAAFVLIITIAALAASATILIGAFA